MSRPSCTPAPSPVPESVTWFDMELSCTRFWRALICDVNLRGSATARGIESSVACSEALGNKLVLRRGVFPRARNRIKMVPEPNTASARPPRNGDTAKCFICPLDLFRCDILLRFVSCHSLTLASTL